MKRMSIFILALALMAATINNVFDDLGLSEDAARENIVASLGGAGLSTEYEVLKKAKALPVELRAAGTRQLIRFARDYSKTPAFQKQYTKWRNERLGYKTKKLSLNPMKALDKAIDKQLNKADDEKRYPAEATQLIKQRLKEFLDLSATVDFDAQLSGSQFVNPAYEAKSNQWKMCYRAGKQVVEAAREEAQTWLSSLE